MSDRLRKRKNDFLIHENAQSSEMYYVESGSLGVFKRKGSKTQQIGTIYAGELVGEMSFFDEKPRSASVKAITECVVKVIPRSKFDTALAKMPAWQRALVNTLIARLRRANSKIRI